MRNILKNNKASSVIETLILIAIMGGLAITTLAGINKTIIKKTNDTNVAILDSSEIDVNKLINGSVK